MDNSESPWQFSRHKEAVHYADLLADAPARALALFAPRQTGKTHFLTHDLSDEAVSRNWHPIYIDLWGATYPLGAIHGAIALAYNNTLRSTLNRQVSKLGAAGLSLELVQGKPLESDDPASQTMMAFGNLVAHAPKVKYLLMVDEAQALGAGEKGEIAMKTLRAIVQTYRKNTMLILTGSSRPHLLALVGDHSKAAFKLATNIDFPLLGMEFLTFIAARFTKVTGKPVPLALLDSVFSKLQNRPGDVIDFMRFWITDAESSNIDVAFNLFRNKTGLKEREVTNLQALSPLQKEVLKVLTSENLKNLKVFSALIRSSLATSLGVSEPIASAALTRALTDLEKRGLVTKISRGEYLVTLGS
jgi:hypothetical protein